MFRFACSLPVAIDKKSLIICLPFRKFNISDKRIEQDE